MISRALLVGLAAALGELPRNSFGWTYTIPGFDGSPYLTRTLLPRAFGWRPMIHQIHRGDADPYPHNHPWRRAKFLVVDGGYVDERWFFDDGEWRFVRRLLLPGDVNYLDDCSLHRAIEVRPRTLTVGLVGDRVQDWGFLVNGVMVPHGEYFRSRGHTQPGGLS